MFLLLMAVVVTTACSADEPAVSSSPEAVMQIEVQLPTYATRTPGGDYDPGSADWENYVDVDRDMRIYFFSSKNVYIGCLQPENMLVSPMPVTGASNFKRYKVTCKVPETIPSDVKILVLANYGEGHYPVEGGRNRLKLGSNYAQTLDALYELLTYEVAQPYTSLSRDCRIPMFGIRQCSGVHVEKGELAEAGTIHLLRAMAKVEVEVHPDEVAQLQSVELEGYNTTGYLAPMNVYSQDDYVTGSWATDYTSSPSVPSMAEDGSGRKIAFGNNDGKFVVYVPEYFNVDGVGNPLSTRSKMKLRFADHDIREFTLEFKDYETGRHFDIKRNYYYKYRVSRDTEDLMSVEVEVYPYSVVELKPDFGIETGTPVWEGMWLVSETPLAFDEMSARYFDWSKIRAGQHLRFYLLSRAPEATPNDCVLSVRRYKGEGNISGLPESFVNPEHGVVDIELTQEMLDDIVANDGISLVCKYLILYRITIK